MNTPEREELPEAWVLRTGHGTGFHDGPTPPVNSAGWKPLYGRLCREDGRRAQEREEDTPHEASDSHPTPTGEESYK